MCVCGGVLGVCWVFGIVFRVSHVGDILCWCVVGNDKVGDLLGSNHACAATATTQIQHFLQGDLNVKMIPCVSYLLSLHLIHTPTTLHSPSLLCQLRFCFLSPSLSHTHTLPLPSAHKVNRLGHDGRKEEATPVKERANRICLVARVSRT